VLVNVFASWCAPCELEAPVLTAMKARGVRMVGVAYKDAPDNTKAFLGRLGDPYAQSLVDRDGRAGIELGVTGVPETYLVDGEGVIRAKHTGPLTAADARDLEAQLAKLAR
jgi:cytochrome c biogenesis protein CcmG/thiol:disulfide interchange protein DsbE